MATNEQRGKEALSHLKSELDSRDRKEKSRPWSVAAISAAVIALKQVAASPKAAVHS